MREGLIRAVFPNPATHRFACEVVLPARAHTALDLIDPRGRIVAKLREIDLPAGVSVLEIEPGGGGGRIPAGSYVLRLTVSGIGQETRSLVLVR